jgi:hypothetical protein
MDNHHYSPAESSHAANNLRNSVSSHQLQQPGYTPYRDSLPPLPHQDMSYPPQAYGSAPHTPRTPLTPVSGGGHNDYPSMAHQLPGSNVIRQASTYAPTLSNILRTASSFSQGQEPYSATAPLMSSSSYSASNLQQTAPARQPVPLRPMPSPSDMHHFNGSSLNGHGSLLSDNIETQPTHVVGSQGRRGILPSAPGRVAVSANASGRNAVVPTKDADGKYPCQHCDKTYLHAKHLKRHLLRRKLLETSITMALANSAHQTDTGDRPYMCFLCRDTFSRSDILKRHFQKCSLRRGNPTGATHLSHSQAHVKKSHPGPHKAASTSDSQSMYSAPGSSNGLEESNAPNGMIGYHGMMGAPMEYMTHTPPNSAPLSRKNSLKRASVDEHRHQQGRSNSHTDPSPAHSQRGSLDGHHSAVSMSQDIDASIASLPMRDITNGHSNYAAVAYHSHSPVTAQQNPSTDHTFVQMQQSNNRANISYYDGNPQPTSNGDWTNIAQVPTQNGYMTPMYQGNMTNGHIKPDQASGNPAFDGNQNGDFGHETYAQVYQGAA